MTSSKMAPTPSPTPRLFSSSQDGTSTGNWLTVDIFDPSNGLLSNWIHVKFILAWFPFILCPKIQDVSKCSNKETINTNNWWFQRWQQAVPNLNAVQRRGISRTTFLWTLSPWRCSRDPAVPKTVAAVPTTQHENVSSATSIPKSFHNTCGITTVDQDLTESNLHFILSVKHYVSDRNQRLQAANHRVEHAWIMMPLEMLSCCHSSYLQRITTENIKEPFHPCIHPQNRETTALVAAKYSPLVQHTYTWTSANIPDVLGIRYLLYVFIYELNVCP